MDLRSTKNLTVLYIVERVNDAIIANGQQKKIKGHVHQPISATL